MKNLFKILTTFIVAHFIIKSYKKMKQSPDDYKKELHEDMLRKKRVYDEQRRLRQKVEAQYASTPRSADAWLANIGTVSEMAAQYKENIPAPKEPCDHAALRPVMGR